MSFNHTLCHLIIALIAFGGMPTSVHAVTKNMPFEITPHVGFRIAGSFKDDASNAEVELDNSASIGLILNLREGTNTQWEIAYAYQPSEIDLDFLPPSAPASLASADGTDIDVHHLQFGGTYVGDGRWARPFMAATVGVAHVDPDFAAFDSDTYLAFSIGAGYKIFPARRIGIRAEARMFGTIIDNDSDIFCTSGVGGANCLFEVSGDVLWQWDFMLGATFRF